MDKNLHHADIPPITNLENSSNRRSPSAFKENGATKVLQAVAKETGATQVSQAVVKENGEAQVAPRTPPTTDEVNREPLVPIRSQNLTTSNKASSTVPERNAAQPVSPPEVQEPGALLLSALERNLMEEYYHNENLVSELETFTLNIWDKGNSAPCKGELKKLLESPKNSRIIVYGLPGFGKSVLCSSIGLRWAKARNNKQSSKSRFAKYRLCIVVDVSRVCVTGIDIEQCIVERCRSLCPEAENIRDVILKVSKQSILILDGFQDIEGTSEEKLKSFLDSELSKFKTLLITSRPVSSNSLVMFFERQADICGCENLHSNSRYTETQITIEKLKFFNGFSVLFRKLIWNIKPEKRNTLFNMTESIINVMLRRHHGLMENKDIFRSLGEFFFRSYVNRSYAFGSKELETKIGKGVAKLEIFIKKDDETFVICHNVFMLFFCVWYLRDITKKTNKFSEFMHVMKARGIDLDIADVYVVYNSIKSLNRFITFPLLPGIVLIESIPNQKPLQFWFLEDVPKVFLDSPWTNSSLLLQCDNDDDLQKYGFMDIEEIGDSEENSIAEKFECIFGLLDFDNLTVSTPIYWNHLQAKTFLKLLVNNEETNSLALTGVFCDGGSKRRASKSPLSRLQATVLNFKCSELEDTYPFLYRLFEMFGSCCLPKSWENFDCLELVFLILKTAVHTSLPCTAQVSLGTEVNSLKQGVTWHVSNSGNGQLEGLYKTVATALDVSPMEVVSLNVFEGDSRDFRKDLDPSDMYKDLIIRFRL